MRLHRLRVTAFQAFAGSETVDFDALGEAGLFLLHGDTGAGKTTLLDAVAFALYGEVPGARARDARLRSDHAAPEVRTEVELEVTLRERRLRIVRRPRQQRPKLRGEGVTDEGHACTVQELGDDGSWTVLAARPDEARAELADLLGMSCEQFCQVVLLPQGEFATFLRSDSTERQAVLERLFGTDRFTRVEHWLTEARKTAGGELRGALQDVRDVVSRLAQAGREEPPEGWESAELEGIRAWAGGLGVSADANAATAAGVRTSATAARTAAEAALAAGAELAERRARLAAAVEELRRWEAGRAKRDAAESELAAARRAAPVAPLLAAAATRAAEAATAAARAAEAGTAASRAASVLSQARPGSTKQDTSPAALRAHAAELRGRAGALDALVAVEQRLARDEAELATLASVAEQADAAAQEAARALAGAATERASLEAAVAAARAAAERAERLAAEAQTTRSRAEQAAERDRLAVRLAVEQDLLRAAVDAEQHAHAAWLDLRERRLAGMAAELAAGLRPGEPCAVCGAVEHPSPAHLDADDGDAAAGAPAPASANLAERERDAETAHAAAATARTAHQRTVASIEAQHAAARAVAGEDPAQALAAAADRAASALADAQAEGATLADAEQRLAALATATARHEQTRRDAEQTAATARATHAERTAALAADRKRIAEARGAHATVAEHSATLRADADAAEGGAAALEAAARAREAHAAAEAAAAAAAHAAGFEDAAAASAAARDQAAQDDLDRRLRSFDSGLAERQALARDPALAVAAEGAAPDLDALRAAAAAAIDADAEGASRHALAHDRLTAVTRLVAELEAALETLAPVAERERRVRELSFLVDGSSASNRLRMRLSAYVLAARLEQVAAAATTRLERMSHGRYQLVHSDEGARGRSRGGLELRIVDGWTGQERPPSTLSGGETFLASLALALGLADVVAAESGGSRLETLFIDEGFGSLDEDTLDTVLDVLDTLREGGRVVGIVSHVAELRQRIPARVHVVKGRSGSRVEQGRAPVVA